jgi:hypothetical protein
VRFGFIAAVALLYGGAAAAQPYAAKPFDR